MAFWLIAMEPETSPDSANFMALVLYSMHLARQPVVLLPTPVDLAAARPPPCSHREVHAIDFWLNSMDRVV